MAGWPGLSLFTQFAQHTNAAVVVVVGFLFAYINKKQHKVNI